jgi:hypothetical protein
MASCTQCSSTFNLAYELRDHTKQLHSASISLKFFSKPDTSVVVVRDPTNNRFFCPGCDKQFEKYQQMYNHSRRVPLTDTSHAAKLEEHLSRAQNEDDTMDASDDPSPAGTKAAVDSLMADCTDPLPIDLGPANLDDIDMDAFFSPYQPTPPTTPKRTHPTDDLNDVDMGAFYSPYKATPPTTPKPIPHPRALTPSDSEDSRPMYSAADKGKQKAVFSPLPQPSASPPTPLHPPPLPTIPVRALPAELPIPAPLQFLSLPIPYKSRDILTASSLNTLNCVLYTPLRILICVPCGIAVQPRSLRRHRKGAHADDGPVSETLVNQLIKDLHVLDGDELQDLPLPFPAVPGIPFLMDGLKCPQQGCDHCHQSRKTMGAHIKTHSLSIRDNAPSTCTIQAVFDSNSRYYPVTLPQLPQATTGTAPPSLDEMTEARYLHIISKIDSLAVLDAAHLSPFLAKYKWHTVVANLEPRCPSEWSSVPRADEIELRGLTEGVSSYYDGIVDEIGGGENWTTVLRFVNTAKL